MRVQLRISMIVTYGMATSTAMMMPPMQDIIVSEPADLVPSPHDMTFSMAALLTCNYCGKQYRGGVFRPDSQEALKTVRPGLCKSFLIAAAVAVCVDLMWIYPEALRAHGSPWLWYVLLAVLPGTCVAAAAYCYLPARIGVVAIDTVPACHNCQRARLYQL